MQTLKKIEVILIDDGSTDNSLKICKLFQSKDPRIKVTHQENVGVSKARENGLKIATGKYISFIDADDYIKEDFLEKLYNEIIENNADLACGNSIDIGLETTDLNLKIEEDKIVQDSKKLFYDYFYGRRYMYTIWGKIIKKEIIMECYFPPIRYTEDTYLMLEIASKSNKTILSSYEGYYYRHNEQSVMYKSKNLDKFFDILTTDEYSYDLINKMDKKLNDLACKKILEDLYGAIVTYSLYGEKKEFEKFASKFDIIYNKIKFNKCEKNLKNKIIFIFSKNKKICKMFLRLIYLLVGKYNNNKE